MEIRNNILPSRAQLDPFPYLKSYSQSYQEEINYPHYTSYQLASESNTNRHTPYLNLSEIFL